MDKYGNEGRELTLDCRAKGKPPPKVTWYKNGQLIHPDNDRVEVKKFKLTIPSLATEDKGNYTCIVSNSEGQLVWTFYVVVLDAAPIWPLLLEGPQNMTVTEGETVQFHCRVLNDPDAVIRWQKPKALSYHDAANSAMSSTNMGKPEFLDNVAGNPEVLELVEVREDEAGEYRCLAGNMWGLKYASAFLTVTTAESSKRKTSTTTTTTAPPIIPGTLYPNYPVFTFGPDVYETSRSPRQRKKDRKEKGNRRKNGRRRKPPKHRKGKKTTTTTTVGYPMESSSTTNTYDVFPTIWNFGTEPPKPRKDKKTTTPTATPMESSFTTTTYDIFPAIWNFGTERPKPGKDRKTTTTTTPMESSSTTTTYDIFPAIWNFGTERPKPGKDKKTTTTTTPAGYPMESSPTTTTHKAFTTLWNFGNVTIDYEYPWPVYDEEGVGEVEPVDNGYIVDEVEPVDNGYTVDEVEPVDNGYTVDETDVVVEVEPVDNGFIVDEVEPVDNGDIVDEVESVDNDEGVRGANVTGWEQEDKGSISLWTIYIIVGAIAGVILIVGLLVITIAVCCRCDRRSVYKSALV